MKAVLFLFSFFGFFFFTSALSSQTIINNDVIKETYVYSVKGADTLYFDKYGKVSKDDGIKPCMIFVFGGGFISGNRDSEYYLSYYDFLVENGYVVVAIDYRLGFKNMNGQNMNRKEFLDYFYTTISMAVEDLFDATNFILSYSEEWNIDKNMIIISGSSAGAITVLHAEYEMSNMSELSKKLPEDFKYAGVISCAGAIYSTNGKLKWKRNPAPIQMFHGDADKNVPYNKIKVFKYGIYGSKNIARQLDKINSEYYFYSEKNADHSLAGTPLIDNHEEILIFLDRYVTKKENLHMNVMVERPDKPDVKKKFKIKDYVKQNFAL